MSEALEKIKKLIREGEREHTPDHGLMPLKKFITEEVLALNYWLPINFGVFIYLIWEFYLPVGWRLIKSLVLSCLSVFYAGPPLTDMSYWGLYLNFLTFVLSVYCVSLLYKKMVLILNHAEGIKKTLSLLVVPGFFGLMFGVAIIMAFIEKIFPEFHVFEALQIIDNFIYTIN